MLFTFITVFSRRYFNIFRTGQKLSEIYHLFLGLLCSSSFGYKRSATSFILFKALNLLCIFQDLHSSKQYQTNSFFNRAKVSQTDATSIEFSLGTSFHISNTFPAVSITLKNLATCHQCLKPSSSN